MKAREYIESIMRTEFPNIDMRKGSAFRDLLDVNEAIFNPILDLLSGVESAMSMDNYPTLSTEDLNGLVANLMVERLSGSYSQGQVRLYFDAAQDLTLLPGVARFETEDGLIFEAKREYAISITQMEANYVTPFYFADVDVLCTTEGENNVAVGEISKFSNVDGCINVTNLAPLEGGTDTETNEELVSRTRDSISSRSFSSKSGAMYKLRTMFPGLRDLSIVGAMDDLMSRDMVYDTRSYESFIEAKFNPGGEVSNVNRIKYVVSSSNELDPSDADWNNLGDVDYDYFATDQNDYYELNSSVVYELDLENDLSSEVGDDWIESDGDKEIGQERYMWECSRAYYSAENWIVLGGMYTATGSDPDVEVMSAAESMRISRTIYDYMRNNGIVVTDEVIGNIVGKIAQDTRTDISPVVQRDLPITSADGVKITGVFKTDDTTPRGRPCYITINRQSSGVAQANDGYGFA